MSCSHCQGIEEQFNTKEARRMLRRFQRRGPDKSTQLLIRAIEQRVRARGLGSSSLLDIGAGVGAIHHELLENGVAQAAHVDASSAHIAAARQEAASEALQLHLVAQLSIRQTYIARRAVHDMLKTVLLRVLPLVHTELARYPSRRLVLRPDQ
jgi:2-polyprenyl-3-methyl-5-hydroxy-6-metoxy-1,4-benzoquinol methylase